MKKEFTKSKKHPLAKEFPTLTELMLRREFTGSNPPARESPDLNASLPDDLPISSSTDCTGLIPSAPQNEEELDSYLEIQHFLPPD